MGSLLFKYVAPKISFWVITRIMLVCISCFLHFGFLLDLDICYFIFQINKKREEDNMTSSIGNDLIYIICFFESSKLFYKK